VDTLDRPPDPRHGRRRWLCRNALAEHSVQRRSQPAPAQHDAVQRRSPALSPLQYCQPGSDRWLGQLQRLYDPGGPPHVQRLWFNANYTYAKGLTDTTLNGYTAGIQQNQYARFLERADDAALRRQQLRFSYVFDIPVGKGQRFGGSMSRPLDAVIGGWQLAGITTMVTGPRLSPAYSNADPAFTNQFAGRPDRIGDGNFDSDAMRDSIKSRLPIFDKSAFVLPATGAASTEIPRAAS
jgi:hypothetical protein